MSILRILNISRGALLGGGVIVVLMMVIALPTVVLIAAGMLPTAVAFLIDRTEQKYASFCVGGMNLSGCYPFLMKLWFDDHTVAGAANILSDVFSLVVIYAAAGFGWGLFLTIPPVVAAFLNVLAQTRVATLRENQKVIVEEWGETVTRAGANLDNEEGAAGLVPGA